MLNALAFGMPGMGEWVVIAVIGLLFFGKRLPEVGRSLGKGIVEFKKGLKGIEEEIDEQVDVAAAKQSAPRLPAQPAPRFDPYTGKPLAEPGHKFDPYTGKPIEADHVETASSTNGSTTDEPSHQS